MVFDSGAGNAMPRLGVILPMPVWLRSPSRAVGLTDRR